MLAAQRSTSISGLLAEQIEKLVAEEDACMRSRRQALKLIDKGFHLGGAFQSAGMNCMSPKAFVDANILI